MLTHIAEEPWALVSADFVGPLPRTRHGNNTLLVFVDKFSKWIELVPLKGSTAAALQKAFRERIVSRYGIPKVFLSDNGTQLTSRSFKKYLQELGVEHKYTAPYTPQENPTERTNRTVKTIISQMTEGDQRNWDDFLPEINLAINTGISDSTGYSPAYLLTGREPRLPGTFTMRLHLERRTYR